MRLTSQSAGDLAPGRPESDLQNSSSSNLNFSQSSGEPLHDCHVLVDVSIQPLKLPYLHLCSSTTLPGHWFGSGAFAAQSGSGSKPWRSMHNSPSGLPNCFAHLSSSLT
jgi:hypothetical protein